MLLDYHGKNLLPSVWATDGTTLTLRFVAQLYEQLKRFPDDVGVFLLGDAVSNYWLDDSDVDVALLVPSEERAQVLSEAERVNGYPLADTDNRLHFWIFPDTLAPSVLARYFGPVYDVLTSYWYGAVIRNETAMRSPGALLQYCNWRLYKAKFDEELYPENWRVAAEAFRELSPRDRERVMDDLRNRTKQVDSRVSSILHSQPPRIWQRAEKFQRELQENEELPDFAPTLPRRVVLALLHQFRYQDLIDVFEEIDEKLHRVEAMEGSQQNYIW